MTRAHISKQYHKNPNLGIVLIIRKTQKPMHDTLPKTTSPKIHFAEKLPCRKDTSAKSLPNFGANTEKVKKRKKKKIRIDNTIICYYKFDKTKLVG